VIKKEAKINYRLRSGESHPIQEIARSLPHELSDILQDPEVRRDIIDRISYFLELSKHSKSHFNDHGAIDSAMEHYDQFVNDFGLTIKKSQMY